MTNSVSSIHVAKRRFRTGSRSAVRDRLIRSRGFDGWLRGQKYFGSVKLVDAVTERGSGRYVDGTNRFLVASTEALVPARGESVRDLGVA